MNSTAQIILAIATLVASLCTGAGVIIAAVISSRARTVSDHKIDAVHDTTNSKMDKLLQLTADASFARGAKSEKEKK